MHGSCELCFIGGGSRDGSPALTKFGSLLLALPGRGGEMKGADTDTLCVCTARRQYFAPHFKKHSDTLTAIRYVFTLLGDNTLLNTLRNTVTH